MIFFIAGILQKNMFFVIPIHFRTYTKHFRRFLTSFWSSAEQRWFRENQRWTALKQRWSALVFLTHSKTALISAEIFEISETALFSADSLWDFNPGAFVTLRQIIKISFFSVKLRIPIVSIASSCPNLNYLSYSLMKNATPPRLDFFSQKMAIYNQEV